MALTFEEAVAKALELVPVPSEQVVPLPDAVGEVLAADVVADRDIPPFPRATMDGYAVRWTGKENERLFRVVGTLRAGKAWPGTAADGECIEIMTGAMVPGAFDTVIPVEEAESAADGTVRFREAAAAGRNIARKGEDAAKGDVLVPRGTLIGPRHVSTLAAVGRWEVPVHPSPSVSVLATGGELKEPWEAAAGAFIRNGNAHFLLAALKAAGITKVAYLGTAPDTPEGIRAKIREGLSSDVLLVTGGVSAGKVDIVPDCLRECGVEKAFHKIAVQPGKPIFAGKSREGCVAVGLPGNPVAVIVHFFLLVLPLLRKAAGAMECLPRSVWLPLAADATNRGERKKFSLGRIESSDGASRVVEIPSRGSGDFVSACEADGVFEIPMGTKRLPAGTPVRFYPVLRHA